MKYDIPTFNFLLESATAEVVLYIMQEFDLGFEQAILLFHNSETFEKLSNPETQLYIESSEYLFELYRHERLHGTLRMAVQ